MKNTLVAAAIILLTPCIALTQSQQGSFSGMWKDSGPDGLILNAQDDGQKITGEVYSTGFDHYIRGEHKSNVQANVVVTRKNINNNCVTNMYATWTLINPNQFRFHVKGTDGRCDLPTSFQGVLIYNKQ